MRSEGPLPTTIEADPVARARELLEGVDMALPEGVSRQRAAVEALVQRHPELTQQADAALLGLRELEQVDQAVPGLLGGVRRVRLVSHDPVSTTWEGWDLSSGRRVLVRALRPRWRRDPVWRRRLQRTADLVAELPGLAPVSWQGSDEWPHLRVELEGATLADHLPPEDPADTARLAALLGAGLVALDGLHTHGQVHGDLTPMHLVWGPTGAQLVWLDALHLEVGAPAADLAALGAAVGALDPSGLDPLGALAHNLAESPPPSTDVAELLLRRALASALADRRHHLAVQARGVARRGARARLLRATRALAASLTPPHGQVCLRAGHDPVLVVAECDGEAVRGGPVGGVPAPLLPTVWSKESGLDAAAARVLLRAWATRARGDEERRGEVQGELGGDDALAAHLCRWVSGQARIRALRMLMELGG